MDNNRLKILFITGSARSGTTILSDLLGQYEKFFAVGELLQLWETGIHKNELCGCGLKVGECDTWQDILNKAFDDQISAISEEMMQLKSSFTRTRHIPKYLLSPPQKNKTKNSQLFLQNTEKLFRAIQKSSQCDVIVDSSKYPAYGKMIEHIPNIQIYTLHIIRDPRGVVYSWQRKKFNPSKNRNMVNISVLKTSILWLINNLGIEWLWKKNKSDFFQIRYEDFITNPAATLTKILDWLNLDNNQNIINHDNSFEFQNNHSINGNPNRFKTGRIKLSLDDEWKRNLNFFNNTLTTLLTWPLLIYYKYKLWQR